MTKKMRKITKEPSPSTSCSSFGDDARQRFKHQSLLQDYMELLTVRCDFSLSVSFLA